VSRLVLADGRSFEVSGELVLGRVEADVSLDDEEVSRRHALLRPAGGGIEILDLGSRNGTWVNGARISAATLLAHGDEVRLGQTSLRVEADVTARATVASPAAAPVLAPFSPPAGRARRAAASRLVAPMVATYAVVVATAVALVVYFAAR
jgi:pSer/pThr/pTyr-binding forkhead associated (FHA) protein